MSIVINSKFRPFSYDEMVRPLAQYKEAYDKVEQDYSNLTLQTEMFKDIVNQSVSPEAYKMYRRYSDDLTRVTDDFSKGMNISNRRAIMEMRRRYAQDITPIANADAAMKAANELRIKAGPDAIFEVGQYNSLDQFLHGKTANNNYTSREALTKKTAAMTEAAMAEALKDPEFDKAMGDQFWLITQHTGGSYEDLMAAIANNPVAQNRFAQIKQKVMADAGIDRYDTAGRMAIEDAVNTGLYAGLDKPVRTFQANADHITPAQRHSMAMDSARLSLARDQFSLSAATSGMTRDADGNWTYDPDKDLGLKKAATIAKIKADARGSGSGSNSNRETISSGAFFVDIKFPEKSHPIHESNIEDIDGTKLNKNMFDSEMRNEKWDAEAYSKTKGKVDKLSTLILRSTGEDTLAKAFDKYDIYVNGDGNLSFKPRKVNIYSGSGTINNTGLDYDPNGLPDF